MLVLTASDDEWIQIGPDIWIQAYQSGTKVKVAIDAPQEVRVSRVTKRGRRLRDEAQPVKH